MTKFIEMEVTPSLQKYMDKLKEGGKVELQVWRCHSNNKASHSSAFMMLLTMTVQILCKDFFHCVKKSIPCVFHVTISMNSCYNFFLFMTERTIISQTWLHWHFFSSYFWWIEAFLIFFFEIWNDASNGALWYRLGYTIFMKTLNNSNRNKLHFANLYLQLKFVKL